MANLIKFEKHYKYILAIILTVSFIIFCAFGIFEYLRLKVANNETVDLSRPVIAPLSDGWEYYLDNGTERFTTSIPINLELPDNTEKITLINKLPKNIPSKQDMFLRFTVGTQTAFIYIDGKEVDRFGSMDVSPIRYSISNTQYVFMIKLHSEYSGKEIKIELLSRSVSELGVIRPLEIGPHRDFILRSFFVESFCFFTTLFSLCGLVLMLLVYLAFWIQGVKIRPLLYMSILTLLAAFYNNTDNTVMLELFGYSKSFSFLNDWLFYVTEAVIPIVGYNVILSALNYKNRYITAYIHFHALCFVVVFALLCTWTASVDFSEPFFITLTTVGYSLIFVLSWNNRKMYPTVNFVRAVFVLIGGLLLDYSKYTIVFLPFHLPFASLTSAKLPYLFFFGIACVFYILLMFLGVVDIVSDERYVLKSEVDAASIGLSHAEKHYGTLLENIENIKRIRHDTLFHLRVLRGLAENSNPHELTDYVDRLIDESTQFGLTQIYCHNYAANVLIGYYAGQFAENGIGFVCNANLPVDIAVEKPHLCTVLGNALQNALEACLKLDSTGERFVELQAYCDSNSVSMLVKNSFGGKLRQVNGRFVSDKSGDSHGLGLSSIDRIVKIYNGYHSSEMQDNTFCLRLVLYFRNGGKIKHA